MTRIYGKWRRTAIAIMSSVLLFSMPQTTAEAAEYVWDYGYTGAEQEFTAPYTGIYQFELSGAQGGNSVFAGGKGGKVTVSLNLKRGDKIDIVVGGQDGYNGGGTGTVSNGGGATDIGINDERIAIAGGGGGGTKKQAGGNGGAPDAGNNGQDYIGSASASVDGSAGGGGGYKGGTAGYYYTETKNHVHSDAQGCFTEPCQHKMTDAGVTDEAWGCGPGVSLAECPVHGLVENRRGGDICGHKELICSKTDDIKVYSVTSFGGSSWYDTSICTNGSYEEGTQTGNGVCNIKILSLYQLYYKDTEAYQVYWNGIKAKQVYWNGVLIYKE